MTPEAATIWESLEFRKPMLLRNIEPLGEAQFRWCDPDDESRPIRNSVAWQLWHVTEVEDNWIRTLQLGEDAHYPFPRAHRDTPLDHYPPKQALLDYFHEVRDLTRSRLEAMTTADFERIVTDPDFGEITIRALWAGVVTSFAWHAGQAAMTAKFIPGSPVTTWNPSHWTEHADRARQGERT